MGKRGNEGGMSDLFSRMVGRATGGGKSPLEPVLSSRYESSRYERLGYGSARGAGSASEGAGGELGFGARGEMAGAGFDGADGAARGDRPVSEMGTGSEGEGRRRIAGLESGSDGFGDRRGPGDLVGESFGAVREAAREALREAGRGLARETARQRARADRTAEAATSLSASSSLLSSLLSSKTLASFSAGADVAARMRADLAEELSAALGQAGPSIRVQDGADGESGEAEAAKRRAAEGERMSLSPTLEGGSAIVKGAEVRAQARMEQNAEQMKAAMEQRLVSREANEVNVTIGTIEVKMAPAVRAPTRTAPVPKVSLEDYLGQRNFGGNDPRRGNGSGR